METKTSKISFTGMFVGSIALLLALVQFWAGPFAPKPTLEQAVAEKAVAIKEATIAALKGEAKPNEGIPRAMDIDKILGIVTAVLGGLAIILGLFGFAKMESLRVAGSAAILGGSAIAFQFAVMAVVAIVVAILVAAVLSQIGVG